MMKKHWLLGIGSLGFLVLGVGPCPEGTDPPSEGESGGESGECGPLTTGILAGQTIESGSVTVSNDGTHLTIDLSSTAPWQIAAVHIYAGTEPVPTNAGGNVAPGQFPYKTELDPPVTSHTETIPLEDLEVGCGDTLNIAVHTEMVQIGPDGEITAEETGWAFGDDPFDGNQWGWSMQYEICCDPIDPDEGCTLTQGYWKNHHSGASSPGLQVAWPLPEDSSLCGRTWLDILNDPPDGGDAWLILAHQWIAATLNVASGASTGDEALAEAEDLLSGCKIAEEDHARAIELAGTLDAYNNGKIGPGHCKDSGKDGESESAVADAGCPASSDEAPKALPCDAEPEKPSSPERTDLPIIE